MPKYFFDLDDGSGLASDTEGSDLPDLMAAEPEAAAIATELSVNLYAGRVARRIVVRVRNERGERVLTITTSILVEHGPGGA
jgi:hypothetical protein